jgi:hypothetical protein
VDTVTELFSGPLFKTTVWITDRADKEIGKHVDAEVITKLRSCAKSGLDNFHAAWPLRPQGGGVWSFGIRDSRSRIAGYFTSDDRKHFIIGGAYKKKGQERGEHGDNVIARVAKMKQEGVEYAR